MDQLLMKTSCEWWLPDQSSPSWSTWLCYLVRSQGVFFEFRGISVANARYHAYVPVSLCPGEFLPPFRLD